MSLRFLIVEGNTAEGRRAYRAFYGRTAGEAYAQVVTELAPGARADICLAADADCSLPQGTALADYDAVFITGSSLNLYDGGPAITRQIDLARAAFASGAPFFGSCWGLQVAAAAAGGEVARNPLGREIGIARDIRPTAAGAAHPLLSGRPAVYDALCSHIDVVTLPEGGKILAANALTPVQAAEIVHGAGAFWGVQYHPEYAFGEIAAIVARRVDAVVAEGLFPDAAAARAYADDLASLDGAAPSPEIGARLRLDAEALDPARRRRELVNFIEARVKPERSARGRG